MACKTTGPLVQNVTDGTRALELWMRGASFEEIGQTLGVTAHDAERVVRSGIEQLHRSNRVEIEDPTS